MNYWTAILTLACIRSCVGYKILCLLPYPGKSHYMVFEPLLAELANRGHQLTVVSFFPPANPQPNRRDVSLVGLAPISVEVVDMSELDRSYYGLARYIGHFPFVSKLVEMNLDLCEKILDADVFKEFVDAQGNYDLILVEHFNSDCMLGIIHKYGLPSVGLMSCSVLPMTPNRIGAPENPSYVSNMMVPLTDKMNFWERMENAAVLYFYLIWFELAVRREEQRIVERKLGPLPLLEDIAKNASVILVNTHYSLNGVRVWPPSVVEVAGIHLHNRSVKPLPPDLEQWVSEARSGFIVFSFGSLVKGYTLPEKRLRAFIKVFAGLPQRVVWKWEVGKLGDLELPDNVRLMKWLPQYDLLNHPNCVAFISHAGALSLTEAVSAGVPVLAIPILGDQPNNAVHAARAGMAAVLSLRELDEDSLAEALKDVLDPKMRMQAKQLSEMWKDRPLTPMDSAVFYVEKAARYPGLELSSQARFLNRIQLALLDIVGFIIFILVSVTLVFVWMCRICLKRKIKVD